MSITPPGEREGAGARVRGRCGRGGRSGERIPHPHANQAGRRSPRIFNAKFNSRPKTSKPLHSATVSNGPPDAVSAKADVQNMDVLIGPAFFFKYHFAISKRSCCGLWAPGAAPTRLRVNLGCFFVK